VTNPESHNAQRHRQTDRRTDANSRSYCAATATCVPYRINQIESITVISSYHIICKIYSAPITFYKTMAALHNAF